ncbi:hypothetical protein S40285_05934 [Stachybotrys chlorohalonatus IBT 40285]|uniref:Uncharacterized protein n=1 Tax=Stachybotrys chlorohalonatus (strain IBT 40285) TaxID=1283841 RepID=A0A084R0E8_STAC4|nr:hypothetical protein S40285_05934 [Stachybotrys chlorohalonata IBT 40285]
MAAPDAKPQAAAAASSRYDEEEGAHGASAETGLTGRTRQAPLSDVDWSRFVSPQYVTNDVYLCNSVMIFVTLHPLGSNASRVIMHPAEMLTAPAAKTADERNARLLIKARDEYGVDPVPIEVQRRVGNDETWADSYTKLLAFVQTQYDRVLALDSNSVVLQLMDELFLTPPCPVPCRGRTGSSEKTLRSPSTVEFQRIVEKSAAAGSDDYDMEIVNDLYLDSATVLPHRPY